MLTGVEIAAAPASSVATTQSVCQPTGGFVQRMDTSADDVPGEACPIRIPLAKNSTFVTEPSRSLTVDVNGTKRSELWDSTNEALFVGVVIPMSGGPFRGITGRPYSSRSKLRS